MVRKTTEFRPVLKDGAVYWSDNGRRICKRCAGTQELYTGFDINGQKVERVTIEDARQWPADLGPLCCERGCTTVVAVAGPDGWPMAKGGAR